MNMLPSKAVYWLANYLASGDATPETRVFRAARQAGIEFHEVIRASQVLGVEKFPGSRSAWWRLQKTSVRAPLADVGAV
jgi:hypothetical protein